jgi:Skp family chaperone for outer membrane proteins
MEIRIVDFELLTRHYINYQDGLNQIEDEKSKFIEKVEPFRKEMQNIIIAAQGGVVLDNLSQEQRMQKFQSLQQEALEVEKEAKIKLKEMSQELNEKVYNELELIVSEWSDNNSIDLVIGKLEVVYLNKSFEATGYILEILKEKDMFVEYTETEKESV